LDAEERFMLLVLLVLLLVVLLVLLVVLLVAAVVVVEPPFPFSSPFPFPSQPSCACSPPPPPLAALPCFLDFENDPLRRACGALPLEFESLRALAPGFEFLRVLLAPLEPLFFLYGDSTGLRGGGVMAAVVAVAAAAAVAADGEWALPFRFCCCSCACDPANALLTPPPLPLPAPLPPAADKTGGDFVGGVPRTLMTGARTGE
jgi:hypothetical protein